MHNINFLVRPIVLEKSDFDWGREERGGSEKQRFGKVQGGWCGNLTVFGFCFIVALSYGEDGHSKSSLSFTSRPDLDCTYSILVLLMTPCSEMCSSTHFSSVTATLFSLNAKLIPSNLRTISFQTGPSLKLSSFLPVASCMLRWVCSINSQFKRGEFSIKAF